MVRVATVIFIELVNPVGTSCLNMTEIDVTVGA